MSTTTHRRAPRSRRGLFAAVLLCLALGLSMLVPVPASLASQDSGSDRFCEDIDPVHWLDVPAGSIFRHDIDCMAAHGITHGVREGVFDPRGDVTRQQMALFVARLIEFLAPSTLRASDTSSFEDLTDVAPAEARSAIESLAAAGVVRGETETTYGPRGTVTRAQMASFVARTLDVLDVPRPSGNATAFPDVSGVHAQNISSLVELGIVQGYEDGTYRPSRAVSREQMARFVVGAGEVVIGNRDGGKPPETNPDGGPETEDDTSSDSDSRTNDDANTNDDSSTDSEPESDDGSDTDDGSGSDDDSSSGSEPGSVSHGTQLRTSDVGYTSSTSSLSKSGPITTSHNGQVIEGRDLYVEGRDNFAITVKHDDVVIRNNRLRFPDGGQGIRVESGAKRVLIEHNEFDAVVLSCIRKGTTSSNNNIGQRAMEVRGPDATVRRNRIKFVRSAMRMTGDGARIVENYIDHLATTDESCASGSMHGTSVSLPGNVNDMVVARNRVVAGQSGGLIIYAQGGPVTNVQMIDNLIVGDGRGFGLYGGRTHLDQGHYVNNRNIRIDNNRFDGHFKYPNVKGEGTNAAVDLSRSGNTFDTNRWVGSNKDLPARCGVSQDACQ
jgi:hypothetical protein